MMKKARTFMIIGFLIAVSFLSSFVVADEEREGDFPCDAGGPYIGIAEVRLGGKVMPVYFGGWCDPPYGKIAYNWTFGDSEYGYGEDPVHEYEEPGEYDVLMEVFVPPYYSNDTTTATIYSNDWYLTVELLANKITVYWGEDIQFRMNVGSEQGQYDDSPPFELVLEIWDDDPFEKRAEIYREEFEPLSPGHSTGWQYKTYTCYLETWKKYWCKAKVVFPNGLEYELCAADWWWFIVWDL